MLRNMCTFCICFTEMDVFSSDSCDSSDGGSCCTDVDSGEEDVVVQHVAAPPVQAPAIDDLAQLSEQGFFTL